MFMSSYNIETDEKLIEKILNGNKNSFQKLYKKHVKYVFNICKNKIGNYELSEEVTATVFIKVYDGLKGFKGKSKFTTWLYKITENSCNDELRKKRRRGKETSLDANIETDNGAIAKQIANGKKLPDEILIAKENKEIYKSSFESLKIADRNILILKAEDGYSYSEIAQILGIDEGTVKSRLYRARNKLKEELNKKGYSW